MTQEDLLAENARLRESLSMCAGVLWRLIDKKFVGTWDQESEGECAHLLDIAHQEVNHAHRLLGLGVKP